MATVLPHPIAELLLEDLRRAALYLDELGAGPARDAATARNHATRLWAASQAVERLVVAVEGIVVQERARRANEGTCGS
jgi:hypothetical protein